MTLQPGTILECPRLSFQWRYVGPEMRSPGPHKRRVPTGRHIVESLQTHRQRAVNLDDLAGLVVVHPHRAQKGFWKSHGTVHFSQKGDGRSHAL